MTVDEAIQKKDEFIRYALNEDIPVSRWARLLVKQYLADIKEAEENPDFPYYFDEEAAIHNYKIFSNLNFRRAIGGVSRLIFTRGKRSLTGVCTVGK